MSALRALRKRLGKKSKLTTSIPSSPSPAGTDTKVMLSDFSLDAFKYFAENAIDINLLQKTLEDVYREPNSDVFKGVYPWGGWTVDLTGWPEPPVPRDEIPALCDVLATYRDKHGL